MSGIKERLNEIENNVMAQLKDFQRATVEHVDYLYRHNTNRVLVSDEVGLGKTLIARGVIAKFAKLRAEEHDDLVKVIYVCSNGAIAEQNLNKLRITRELKVEGISSSRLSMQHLNIAMQENDENVLNNYIQLIPLTPDTSLKITNSSGTANERALIYAILSQIESLKPYAEQLNTLLICTAHTNWESCKQWYIKQVDDCDKKSKGKYLEEMCRNTLIELNNKQPNGKTYLEELISCCNEITQNGNRCTKSNTGLIVKLRIIFSKISLDKLQPDLIIMDEFQRFKDLLSADKNSETGMLTNKFFNSNSVRMLLLSATPYKMYSTLDEIEEQNADEHYEEFLSVLKFLNITNEADIEFHKIWSNYSIQLKEFANGNQALIQVKNDAENALYTHVCRTERIEADGSADLIDDSSVKINLKISTSDIKSYIQMQKLLNATLQYNVPVDYIKSCPYLLSFMRDYKLKRDIEEYFKNNPTKLNKLDKETFFIKRKDVESYNKIGCNNARLESLLKTVLSKKEELFLWVPPSKPYYDVTFGPYQNTEHFSKTLIFSSWEMVPRMIASLVSYEAERKTIGKLAHQNDRIKYFPDDKRIRYPLPKLKFAIKDGKPANMSLFCLLYPSQFLADCYNPIDCLNRKLSLEAIIKEIKQKISEKLLQYNNVDSGNEDKRWYYIAPLLLDGGDYCNNYAEQLNLNGQYDSADDSDSKEDSKGFTAHLQELKNICKDILNKKDLNLGKLPADLIDVLADMSIASPAVCAYRSYHNHFDEVPLSLPTQVAEMFRKRMNTPESTAVIELSFASKNDDAFWQNILTYCKAGNFQSMFDEYLHLMASGINSTDVDALKSVHNAIIQSMSIKTTPYSIDTYNTFKLRVTSGKTTRKKEVLLRSHFAVAFTKGEGTDKDTDRKKTVRNAFNSPFRPFVLASTSIGQEGLDFHFYCRRIVHWNLPSNPIDLEQREGRINRYKCLAIRQNIAERYGNIEFTKDVWNEMFDRARKTECNKETSELVPYWGLKEMPDMVKIERIVPMYSFSRDISSYDRLMKILNLYRLTLGQARQEELLEYIIKNHNEDSKIKQWFINLSPYYKDYFVRQAKAVIVGHAVGDALGVPVEFEWRDSLDDKPVTDMTGYGTYPVPKGTWSDDTSMSLCALASLANGKIDFDEIMSNFGKWCYEGEFTATGEVFDIGNTCRQAIDNYCKNKMPYDKCGLCDNDSNGNGSLMRINPFVLVTANMSCSLDEKISIIHTASSLTHAHKRSQIGCGIYAFVLWELLKNPVKDSVNVGLQKAKDYYKDEEELTYYERLLSENFANTRREVISSSGYIVLSLEAAIWCLLNTESYKDCILKAVNLGWDTDTIAAIAGGLAGALYGYNAIPQTWRDCLAKRDYIEDLCVKAFTKTK